MIDEHLVIDHPPGAPVRRPSSMRVAAVLLGLVGVANAAAGAAALVAAQGELRTGVAVGLLAAGAATALRGRLVWRGSHVALYVALGVFELLLIARVVTIGGADGAEVFALVLLVALVAVLWLATIQVRRAGRRESLPG